MTEWSQKQTTLSERVAELKRENERLREALRPFARAEQISASYLADQRIRCVLTYKSNASETFNLAALDIARAALGEGK